MNKFAIAIHGGAGPDSDFIQRNVKGYESGLESAVRAGYRILEDGGSALDAVQKAVEEMENNPLFNAGRGGALNNRGDIEMDASLMNGENLKAGAVSMVRNVKNPIALARFIMENTNHVLLSGNGALELAAHADIELETDAYFITEHQYDVFIEERDKESFEQQLQKRVHGTVGAVALDIKGNIAAATSTGGTSNSLPGRIGDSCVIGAGCSADNNTCAVSGTGDGEFLIRGVIAHTIAAAVEMKQMKLQEACDFVVHERNKNIDGDIGVISINKEGVIGISFNSERMRRAWMSSEEPLQVRNYK